MSTSFWQRVRSVFRPRDQVRPDDPSRSYYRFVPYAGAAGVVVTNEDALSISVVWGCVTAITSAIASCQWNVYTLAADGKRKNLQTDPLQYLLNIRPNPDMTAIAFREALLFGALTWGNGYAEIVKSGSGKVTSLWPILPSRVRVCRDPPAYDEDGNLVAAGALFYEVREQDGKVIRLEADQMFHIRGPSVTGLMGDNPVARAALNLGLAAAQERFASTYFGNNTEIGGVIESPKAMSDDAHKNFKDSWNDAHKGPDRAHKIVILEEGMKFTKTASTASEAQLIDSRKYQIEEICRIWHCPPHKVQHLDKATFNNIEHLAIEFVRDALTPWAVRLEQEADFKLVPTRGLKRQTKLDMGWLTHGDFLSRMTGYQIARRTGVYSINDILHREGENTIGPIGDTRIVEANMQTLDQLEAGVFAPKGPGGGDKNGAGSPADDGTQTGEDPGQGDQQDGGDGIGGAPANSARDALVLLFASTLERYHGRLEAREKDLRRGGASESKIRSHMAEERVKLRQWVLGQAQAVMSLAGTDTVELLLAVDAIDNGQNPREAAQRLVANGKRAA